jgi:hypothetical protein
MLQFALALWVDTRTISQVTRSRNAGRSAFVLDVDCDFLVFRRRPGLGGTMLTHFVF